jgi:hypothetical protein
MSPAVLAIVLIALSEASQAIVVPITKPDPDSPDGSIPCGFRGNSSLYGVGTRLGLYFQWMATSLAYNFVPEDTIIMRVINCGFYLSNIINLFYVMHPSKPILGPHSTANASVNPQGTLWAVEAYVVLLLCFAWQNAVHRKGRSVNLTSVRESFTWANFLGWTIYHFLSVATTFYSVWFVYAGMDRMKHSSCSHYAFFFTRVDLYGWFRTLLKIAFTFGAIMHIFGLVVIAIGLYALSRVTSLSLFISQLTTVLSNGYNNNSDPNATLNIDSNADSNANPNANSDSNATSNPPVAPSILQESMQGINHPHPTILIHTSFTFALMFAILGIELTVKWNHIEGVNSLTKNNGDIFPLAVSCLSLLWIFGRILRKMATKEYCT